MKNSELLRASLDGSREKYGARTILVDIVLVDQPKRLQMIIIIYRLWTKTIVRWLLSNWRKRYKQTLTPEYLARVSQEIKPCWFFWMQTVPILINCRDLCGIVTTSNVQISIGGSLFHGWVLFIAQCIGTSSVLGI